MLRNMRGFIRSLKRFTNVAMCQTRRLRKSISNLASLLSCPSKSSSGYSLSKRFDIGTIQGETCCGVVFLCQGKFKADNDAERRGATPALLSGPHETINETIMRRLEFPCSKDG